MMLVGSGLADLVMVLGVEKLNVPSPDEAILNMGTGVDREWEAAHGLTAPPCFALAAQAHMARHGTTEEQMARVSVKNHNHAAKNPYAHFQKGATLDQVLCSRMIATPFRLFMCSPITDGAAAMVLARGDRARELRERPAWITGLDHRTECHNPSFRALDDSPSTRIAAEAAGLGTGPVEVAELQAAFSHEELLLRHVLGLGDDVDVNPSGGALRSNPIMATGLCRIGYAADHIFGGGSRALAHATSGPCLQQNLICILEGDR